jgi:uncharacterized RDD family membrane protein YckC
MTSSYPGGPQDPWGQQPAQPPLPGGGQPVPPEFPAPPMGYPSAPGYGQARFGTYPGPPMPPGGYPYGYGPPPAPVPGGRLASMGARFGGLVIDTILVAIPSVVVGAFTGAFGSTQTCDAFGNCTSGGTFHLTWPVSLTALLIGIAYSAYFVGMRGQTLGHRVAGVRVVDVRTGALIGPGRAALRWFVMVVTGAICTVGYWSPFFDSQQRRGWHDKSSGSVAIPAR